MAYSEDHIALAAEYALGTLDAEERAQVEAMMSVDKDFTAMVDAWEQKLGVLNQMVGLVEPRPIVWENIKAAVGHSDAQAPLVLPEAAPVPVPETAQPDVSPSQIAVDHANVVLLSGRVRRWRTVATAMEVAADSPDPLARREMTEELKRLLECVGRLEPDRQKLVLLAYYNGWSREQLAVKFETPVNTVKTWLRRSMLDIRECLGL